MAPQVYAVKEVAAIFGVSDMSVYRQIHAAEDRGEAPSFAGIPALRVTETRYVFSIAQVDAVLGVTPVAVAS